jgi:hypothetical protein
MPRRAFFSFHYERDVWRASQVRNSWVTKPDREAAGFWDAAEWERVKGQGDEAIKRWIDRQLEGTSVTVVLIGAETSDREWVRYEIQRSYEKGNGIVGIYIHNLKDSEGNTDRKGNADFGKIDREHEFKDLFRIYDWVDDDGYENLGDWVERAALIATRPSLEPPLPRSARPGRCGRSG